MSNPYTATLRSAADDGTNMYLLVEISDGSRTMPLIQLTVPTGTVATAVSTYLQNIATNQPTVGSTIQALINVPQAGL